MKDSLSRMYRIASLAKLKSSSSKKRQKRKQESVTAGRSEEFSLLMALVQEKSYEMSSAVSLLLQCMQLIAICLAQQASEALIACLPVF